MKEGSLPAGSIFAAPAGSILKFEPVLRSLMSFPRPHLSFPRRRESRHCSQTGAEPYNTHWTSVSLQYPVAALLLFVLILSASIPMATAAEKPAKALTLPDALEIALEKNRDILKAQEYRKQVAGRYVEERAAALPQFMITSGIYRSRDESQMAYGPGFSLESQTKSATIGLNQVLFTFGQIGAAIRGAKMGIASADEQLRIFRQAALRDVSAAFYDALLSGELLKLSTQNLEQKERHRDEVQKKLKLGVATDYDVLSSEVAVQNARPEVIRMENLVRISREKLRFLLGLGDAEVELQGDLGRDGGPYPRLEETAAKARLNRPDIADIGYRISIAGELITIAKAGDKPRLDLKADWGWRDLTLENSNADGQTWMAGIFLTYPFFDGMRSQGRVLQARSNLATLKIEEAKLLDEILLQSRGAVDAVRESGEIVKALTATVAQADQLLQMAEKGYEFGVKTKLDVDDAALNRMQARSNLARARRDYLVALATLDWVMGTIGEEGK